MATKPKSNTRTIRPLSTPTRKVDITGTREAVIAFWDAHHMLASLDANRILGDVSRVYDAADRLGVETLDQVIQAAGTLIDHLADLKAGQRTQFLDHEVADLAHRSRNALIAVLGTITLLNDDDPAAAHQLVPDLQPRGALGRALFDDEVLLARLEAHGCIARDGRSQSTGTKYVLADAGLWPSEVTTSHSDDLDNLLTPTTVYAAGVQSRVKPRDIPLDSWGQAALTTALGPLLATSRRPECVPLCYTPTRKSTPRAYSAAGSSALTVHLWNAGVRDDSLQALGIVRWRVSRALTLAHTSGGNLDDVVLLSGKRDVAATCEFLKIIVETTPDEHDSFDAWDDLISA